ncbi:hypothetical protein [Sinorhizobium fredii]|uniref:hypothetical protein n=1 Tax=Rhizobium fredii TaxID=380 RepID=UPI003514CEFD
MPAELTLPLSLQYVRETPAEHLLAAVKNWLSRSNPICLVHPHGFFVVPVDRTDVGDWRFHLWPKGKRPVRGMPAFIHNHDRHVDSRILSGHLTNITYDVALVEEDGLPLYDVGYGGDRYEKSTSNFLLKTTSQVQARTLQTETVLTGQHYRVDRYAYHEAQVPEGVCTASLAWMHSKVPGPVNVVGIDGYPERIEFQRMEFAGAELAKLLPV